jgi:hypothetical protein
MQVKCNLCGGGNTVHPGQKMLFCSFCGSALSIEKKKGPEHLILPHKRNDKHAGEALRSWLLSKNRPQPKNIKLEFSYLPFLMIEDDKGKTSTALAPGIPFIAGNLPYPPAGNYRFFDETLAGDEKVVPFKRIEEGILRILHLPVYEARYDAGGGHWAASIIGESWQMLSDAIPKERSADLDFKNVLIAACLFVVYLLIGKMAPSTLSRFVLIFIAGSLGFLGYYLRTKLVKKS